MNVPAALRDARIERNLDLERLSTLTALKIPLLEAIEGGEFQRLPSGVYARSYVRTYASAVGLDPAAAVRAVAHLLPDPSDPLPALRARAEQQHRRQPLLAHVVAGVIDALLLFGIDFAMVAFVSLVTGVALDGLVRSSGAVAAPCLMPVAAYVIVFGALAGQTPGEWLFNCPARRALRIRVK